MIKIIPKWIQTLAIPGLLLFGGIVTVLIKLIFEQQSFGKPEYGNHYFQKPIFHTASMFFGETLALILYFIQKCISSQSKESILSNRTKLLLYAGAPALCDTVSTTLQAIALLSLTASSWQMFRGSKVLFSWILSVFYMKKRNRSYMTTSIFLIIVSLTIVGISSVCQNGISTAGVSTSKIILSIFLVIAGQFIQALQIVIDDYLLHNTQAPPVFLVGLEGVWGTVITCGIVMPISQNLPGTQGQGIHEDTIDSLKMLGNNWFLLLLVISYIAVVLFFNVLGMFVTDITNAIVRTIMDGVLALFVWLIQIILFYSLRNTKYGHEHSDIGESLTLWSIMEFSGFLLLFIGTLSYNGYIRLPFHDYREDLNLKTPLIEASSC